MGTLRDLVLLSRAGCHLCETARLDVAAVAGPAGVPWREIDVDTDPELRGEWGDLVPVILLDGVCLGYYTVEKDRLAAALAG